MCALVSLLALRVRFNGAAFDHFGMTHGITNDHTMDECEALHCLLKRSLSFPPGQL